MNSSGDESGPDELRERTKQQLLASFGGWSGTVVTAVPPVVFVIVNATAGLRPAIIAALLTAAVLAVYRLLRKQPLQQALTGMLSVAVAAFIAARTGEARGFFLVGIASSIAYGSVFAISLLLRRPLVGVLWEFLEPSALPEGRAWYRTAALRRAYDLASLAALTMFAARAIVQLRLFNENKTGLLAVTKLVMGFPLYIAVLGFAFWVVRRARGQLAAVQSTEPDGDVGSDGGANGLADGGLSLGQRDEQ